MARFGLISVPCLRQCHPCRASSFFRPFSVPPVVTVFTLSDAWNWETVVFLFPAPQVSAWGPCFRSVDLFPPGWNGGFHLWRYLGVPLGRLLRPVVSPRFKCPGCRFTWSPGLFLLELLPPTRSGCGSYRCPSGSSHPSPARFSSKTSASWVSTVASAPDSERAFAFGSFSHRLLP